MSAQKTRAALEAGKRRKALFSMGTLASGGAFGLGLLLFMWKLQQTSDFALRYDRRVQEEVGMWVLSLGLLGLIAIALLIATLVTAKSVAKASETHVQSLQDALAEARASQNVQTQVQIESELRRLGA